MKRPALLLVPLLSFISACAVSVDAPPRFVTIGKRISGSPIAHLPALESQETLVPLPVPGYLDAVVALPNGARAPRPVLVAGHGNRDDPGGHCEYWSRITDRRAFVLCPRGTPRPDGGGFTHGKELAGEIDAGLGALAARYAAWVDRGPVVYGGYSQGSYVGTGVVMRNPALFPRVILIEGNGAWNEKKFAEAGGQRVLFACGTPGCEKGGLAVAARLQKAGVAARVEHSLGAGHTLGGAVEASVKESFTWVTAGDPRW
jgi:hypothetical protein